MRKTPQKTISQIIGIAWICLLLLSTAFIFLNSMASKETSLGYSDNIIEMIAHDQNNSDDAKLFELAVRKAAHLIEFSMLGFVAMCLCNHIKVQFNKDFFGYSLFYVLAVAVADEHIQSFSDRTSSTGDIILDFCGAVIGFLIGWLAIKIYYIIKNHRRNKNIDGEGQ